MIKYYVVDVEGGNVNKAVSSICEYQGVDTDDVVVIKGSVETVFSVPRLQGHSGIGMVLLSSSHLTSQVDVDEFVNDGCLMMRDLYDRLFVLDCSKPYYKDKIGVKTPLAQFASFSMGSPALWKIAIDLGKVVGSESEPAPDSGVEESQNHWDVLDQYPNSDE